MAMHITVVAQSEKPVTKEIDFKHRHAREGFDIVKFFVEGNLTTENMAKIQMKMNAFENISNFKIIDIPSGECYAEIKNTTTADEFRICLQKTFLDFNRNSIKILNKSYYQH